MDLPVMTKSYALADCPFMVGGFKIHGFSDGGGVKVEFEGDLASVQKGADGESTVSQLSWPQARVKFTLMAASTSNGLLYGLLVAQRNTPSGYILPVALEDPHSGEAVLGGQAVFTKLPAIEFAKESGEREWELVIPSPIANYAVLSFLGVL